MQSLMVPTSISIGSLDVPFYKSQRAIDTFGCIGNGVVVCASGGNRGPDSSSLSNPVPWITTVGASSIDRDFPAFVTLANGVTIRGTSTYKGVNGTLVGPFPLVYDSTTTNSTRCLKGSLNPNVTKGKIVMCDKLLPSKNPGEEVRRVGGVGMIVANEVLLVAEQWITNLNRLRPNNVSSISVSFRDGESIKSYINSTDMNNATATMNITGSTVVGEEIEAPIVAAFSSRGPTRTHPFILKPDLIAQGDNTLAAVGDGTA